MGAINLKHTGSGAAIALSSDGTSLLLDGTAIGGGGGGDPDLYRDNASSAVTPIATGANAFSIGTNTTASNTSSIAIGAAAVASGYQSQAIGNQTDATATNSSALGQGAQATASNAVAIGKATASASYSTAMGKTSGNDGAVATTGAAAMALNGYASGVASFAAAINNNTSSYGATNTSSIAIGKQAKATGAYGTAIGEATQATASNSVCLGYYSQATGQGSLAFGYDTQATGLQSTAIGLAARNPINGSFKFAGGKHQTSGDSQTGIFPLLAETTDATATAMVTYHNNSATASTDNQVVLPNNSVYGFTGTIIARENSAQTNDFAVWEVKGGAVRAASAATTALGSYNINKISESTGAANWSIAISADTTNGAIAFTVTGEAAHSIRWVATINTTEVTY